MTAPAIQTINGPSGMVSHINWTLLGWVLIQRAAMQNNSEVWEQPSAGEAHKTYER